MCANKLPFTNAKGLNSLPSLCRLLQRIINKLSFLARSLIPSLHSMFMHRRSKRIPLRFSVLHWASKHVVSCKNERGNNSSTRVRKYGQKKHYVAFHDDKERREKHILFYPVSLIVVWSSMQAGEVHTNCSRTISMWCWKIPTCVSSKQLLQLTHWGA